MCYHVFLHSSSKRAAVGEILHWHHTFVCMLTQKHRSVYTSTHTHMLTCFTRTLERREERTMTSSDISISTVKDAAAHKVSRCAVYRIEIKSPDLS